MPFTLPNILTLFRLLAAPFIAVIYLLFDRPLADGLAFALFTIASLTDFIDGYLARKLNQMTEIGRVLDPIADKVTVVIALAVLMGTNAGSAIIILAAAIILFREVLVSGLREALGDRATALKVTQLAKWKTTAQMVAIGLLFLAGATTSPALQTLGLALLAIAAILTAITGWDYAQKAVAIFEEKVAP